MQPIFLPRQVEPYASILVVIAAELVFVFSSLGFLAKQSCQQNQGTSLSTEIIIRQISA